MLKRLAELRKSRNWSMQETADKLGIAKSTYAGYESGYRLPSIQALAVMADIYETTVDSILDREAATFSKLELAELLVSEENILLLDNSPLTVEELRDFIAFTRVKRDLKSSFK